MKQVFYKGVSLAMAMVLSVTLATTNVGASGATSVSTGEKHACAIVNGAAKCWGANTSGQLGNGTSSLRGETTPVTVVSQPARTETIPKHSECVAFFCKDVPQATVQRAAVGLGGKSVSKITAGADHTCAIASAKVYCWGNNSDGQLGNGKAGLTKEQTPVALSTDVNSVLNKKEIIDVSAGDKFTCALASDGIVACWGKGTNGRLGTNNTSDKKVPTVVYTGAGSALAGKKAYKLAKASGATMCALAIPMNANSANGGGSPVCWGYGIDNGTGLPGNNRKDVRCGASSPGAKPKDGSETTIFSSTKPVAVPGAQLHTVDGNDYVTGLSAGGQTYYWGMYGYRTDTSYSDIDSCRVDCRGRVTFFQDSERSKNLISHALTSTAILVGMKRVSPGTGDRGANKEYRHDSCDVTTHYGFTETVINSYVGQKVTTQPPSTSLTSGVSVMAGNVYGGLYCAQANGKAACDANGTDATNGSTGNGWTKECVKSGWTTTCKTSPVGPQPLMTSGWLSGKTITQLSTGSTGYACAVASGSVGCWGENSNGQLGVGDTTDRNVPTGVGL